MSETAERLREELKALPQEERAELAYFLLDTLDEREEIPETELNATLARRAKEIESGKAEWRPADEVHARLREKYS